MSRTVTAFGLVLIGILLSAGIWFLTKGEVASFFKCMIGAAFMAGFLYVGTFFQSLNLPARKGVGPGFTSLKEEVAQLAEANPHVPALRRLYGWLVVGLIFTVLLRVI